MRVLHTSDLHLGADESRHSLDLLQAVIDAGRECEVDLLLLVGDIFDHNRVRLELLNQAASILDDAGVPAVILPGNHDCLSPDSVYRRGRFADLANVHVIGVHSEDCAFFPELGLEIWGRPHLDHFDMEPLREPGKRTMRWRIAAAHGHWVSGEHDLHRAYLIKDHDLEGLDADYLALGHWDRHSEVGDGSVPAFYSGSPVFARTVNIVEFDGDGLVRVTRSPVTGNRG